jgi:hypothetical protein
MAHWAFIEHVTDYMGKSRPSDEKHPTQWPSEATALVDTPNGQKVIGKCRRAAFFRLLIASYHFYDKYSHFKLLVERLEREQVPADRYMMWIWRQGELYEEYLVEAAKRSGVFIDAQSKVYIKSFNVSGSIDIEVINPKTGKYSIVESKSVYGHGADSVLGSQYERSQGSMGEPKDSNLMQIALYHWWRASQNPDYEESRLVYGSRDTGRYGEFSIRTVEDEDGLVHIEYRAVAPYEGEWIRTPITINSILSCYQSIQQALDAGVIPARDFSLQYSDAELAELYKNNMLSKSDTEKYEAFIQRKNFNAWVESIPSLNDEELINSAAGFETELTKALLERVADYHQDTAKKQETTIKHLRALQPKREYKPLAKGDWQCRYCQWRNTCFTEDGTAKKVSI